jgi:hypothetical protein
MFARQLAQHTQRSPKWFLDRRGFEIGQVPQKPWSRPVTRGPLPRRAFSCIPHTRWSSTRRHPIARGHYRPCERSAHCLLDDHPHRHAVEIGTVAIRLDVLMASGVGCETIRMIANNTLILRLWPVSRTVRRMLTPSEKKQENCRERIDN